MRVRELCGPGRDLDVRDLPQLLARFPWVRDARPATLEDGLRHLAATAPALLVDVPEPTEKAEQPPAPPDPPPRLHSPWDAVRWMAGSPEPPAPHVLRDALVRSDGDAVDGALRAYGFEPTNDLRAAVAAWHRAAPQLRDERAAELPLAPPELAGDPEVVEIFRAAWAAGRVWPRPDGELRVQQVDGGGVWRFLPDREVATGAAAAAFSEVAKAWGIGTVPQCHVLTVGDRRGCFQPVPSREAWTLDQLAARSTGLPRAALLPSLRLGELHRWAVLDYVCGNPDRVGSEVAASWDGSLALLAPARSAFGPTFGGPGTFVPAYVRCWAPAPWSELSEEERWSRWPAVPDGQRLGGWLLGLTPDPVLAACAARGVSAGPAVGRLQRLQAACRLDGADVATRRAWLEWARSDP